MKRQRVLSFFSLRQLWETPHFVFLTVMLLCGALAGSFTGLRSGQYEGALLEQLAGQMTAPIQDTSWRFIVRALLGAVTWQAVAILFGRLRASSLLISGLCAARGFLAAFSAAAFLAAFSWRGLVLSLLTGGVSAVITIPCLLITSTACFLAGQDRKRPKDYWYMLLRYRAAILCCMLLSVAGGIVRIPMLLLASGMEF
ncbi:MAG: hypothetical protein KHY76_10530 [Butyricicoccus pullicaecorum]|nr:hypothetical protein [Butyricicoccus pullicaecorum]